MTTGDLAVARQDLPGLHTAASVSSADNQRRFFRLTRLALGLALVGAAGGAIPVHVRAGGRTVDVAAAVAAASFAALLATTVYLFRAKLQRRWYQARAVAESVKSLSWLYVTGAGEFPVGLAGDAAEERFQAALCDVPAAMNLMGLRTDRRDVEISGPMRRLRAAAPPERLQVYRRDRVMPQLRWYREKSAENSVLARRLFAIALVVQVAGIAAGIVVAVTASDVDPLGVAAAAAAAVTAWQQAKDHDNLAVAYQVTAHDLELVAAGLPGPDETVDDDRVAAIVGSAERAISREHTIWRARGGLADPS